MTLRDLLRCKCVVTPTGLMRIQDALGFDYTIVHDESDAGASEVDSPSVPVCPVEPSSEEVTAWDSLRRPCLITSSGNLHPLGPIL